MEKKLIFDLVGTGPEYNPDFAAEKTCGHIRDVSVCEVDGTEKIRRNFCKTALCRYCHRDGRSINYAKEKPEVRIKGRIGLNKMNGVTDPRKIHPRHVIISVPRSEYSRFCTGKVGQIKAFKSLRRSMKYRAKKLGITGAFFVFHAYRLTGEAIYHYQNDPRAEGLKKWEYFYKFYRDDIYEWVKFGPHWHLVGWGYLQKADEYWAKNKGWLYRNKGWLLGEDDISRCLYYMLSHRAYVSKVKMVGYMGSVSYHQLGLDEIERSGVLECPECSKSLFELCDYEVYRDSEGREYPFTLFDYNFETNEVIPKWYLSYDNIDTTETDFYVWDRDDLGTVMVFEAD